MLCPQPWAECWPTARGRNPCYLVQRELSRGWLLCLALGASSEPWWVCLCPGVPKHLKQGAQVGRRAVSLLLGSVSKLWYMAGSPTASLGVWGNVTPRRLVLASTTICSSLLEINTWPSYLLTFSSLSVLLDSWEGDLAESCEDRPQILVYPYTWLRLLVTCRPLVCTRHPALSPLSDHMWLFNTRPSNIENQSDVIYLGLCFTIF